MIPIAKPVFTDKVIEDVISVLMSGHLRQGTKTEEFEKGFCKRIGSEYACAVDSGTAALHVSYLSTL